jgi:hypothetical protein
VAGLNFDRNGLLPIVFDVETVRGLGAGPVEQDLLAAEGEHYMDN